MKQFMKKAAIFLALVLVIHSIPVSAKAETAMKFRTTRTTVYENSSANGVYKYTVSGLTKGYKIKWGITGTGKKYVTLKYKTTTAAKTTSSNQITINTNGEAAAKNVKFNVIAKVFDKSGKQLARIADKPTIKVQATNLTMNTDKIGALEGLLVGTAYSFSATAAPANTTSKIYWTVTAADGTDHSSEITGSGVWTPTAAGEYTIKAEARNSDTGKVLCTASAKANVGVYIKRLTQTGSNELELVFSADMTDKLTNENVIIKAKTGTSTVVPKEFKYNTTGTTVTITTRTNFKDDTAYVLSYEGASESFTASVGEPVTAKILTQTVPADSFVTLEYALYDSNGIDVKNACTGTVDFDGEVTNGMLTGEELYMTTPGKTATVTLTYTKADGKTLTASKVIKCVEATVEEAVKTEFTITSSDSKPDYAAKDYAAVNYIALEEKGYAHFRAFNAKGEEILYDSVKFSSSDDDTLLVEENGELTPIKTGAVKVYVTVTTGNTEDNYTFSVNVKEAKKISRVSLSSTAVTMSNSTDRDYQETILVTAYDQYKNVYDLSEALVEVEPVQADNNAATVTFDESTDQIVIKEAYLTGSYAYKVKVTIGEKSASANFKLTVKQIPYNSNTLTYVVKATESTVDTAVDKNTLGDKTVTLRLAQYRGGVFEEYKDFESAEIKMGGKYFNADLTQEGSTEAITLGGASSLELTAMKLGTECKKAVPEVYTITVKYYNESGASKSAQVKVTVTDTQKQPAVSVEKTTSDKKVTDALELVKECLHVSSGYIYDCTATGEKETGSKISISSGDKLHINTISVKEEVKTGSSSYPTAYVYYTITVNKTLQNK